MEDKTIKDIYRICAFTAMQAGLIALRFVGKVEDQGKEVDDSITDAKDRRQVAAKTDIDELIQLMFLQALVHNGYNDKIMLDVEEETELLDAFATEAELKLVIDPIDGTVEFIDNLPDHSINCALVSKNGIEFNIVYFPAYNLAFTNLQGEYSRKPLFGFRETNNEIFTAVTADPTMSIMYNRRFTQEYIDLLEQKGIKTSKSTGMFDPLHEILGGTLDALYGETPNPRDLLFHEILTGLYPDYFEIYDYSGNDVDWFAYGRIPEFIFARKGLKEQLIR